MRVDRGKWLALLAVTAAAFCTYVPGFGIPEPFWDERYYIVDAQKYLRGVYFAQLHPPLGKLLIALGEWLVSTNPGASDFLDVTYWAETVPKAFSMVGFRAIPILLAWMTAPLLFFIFLKLLRNRLIACLLCGLYVFDNALVAHLRSAMLESTLLFFAALLMLAAIPLIDEPVRSRPRAVALSAVAGFALGCILTTKVIGLVFGLIPFIVALRLRADRRLAAATFLTMTVSALIVVIGVWEVHFALARRVNPALMANGFYQTPSPEARAFLEGPDAVPVRALPAMMREAVRYALWYDASRPAPDLCKPDEEASPFWMWPLGARSVPYLWESEDEGRSYRFLYLQVNPVVWWTALAGVLTGVWLLARSALVPGVRLKRPFLLTSLAVIYAAYFIPFPFIHGVMYLYHYFVPLLVTFVILAAVIDELIAARLVNTAAIQIALAIWLAAAAASFWIYRPLTYFERPMTADAIERRNIFPLWDLRCVGCPHTDGLCPAPPTS